MKKLCLSFCSLIFCTPVFSQMAHQNEYLPMAKEKSVQDLFLSQLTDVVGEDNVGTWRVVSSPAVQGNKKDFSAFTNIFVSNCQSLTASGTAKSKFGKVQSEVKISRTGTDPVIFKIVVTATKDLVVKKITKSVSVDIHLALNASPKETKAQLGVAIIQLKGRAANLAESEIAKKVQAYVREVSSLNSKWKQMLAYLNSLLFPMAEAKALDDLEAQDLLPAIKVAEVLLYSASYSLYRNVYKSARDIDELEMLLRSDFNKLKQ